VTGFVIKVVDAFGNYI